MAAHYPVSANILVSLAENDFTHAQLSQIDDVYRQDDAELFFLRSDDGDLVAERAFSFGGWFLANITTTKPSGVLLKFDTNFGGIVSTFTWGLTTLETGTHTYGNSDWEYDQTASSLGTRVSTGTTWVDYTAYVAPPAGRFDNRHFPLGYHGRP